MVPLELQPQSERRQTRAAFDKALEEKHRHTRRSYTLSRRHKNHDLHVSMASPSPKPTSRGPGRPPKTPKSPVVTKAQPTKSTPASLEHRKRRLSQQQKDSVAKDEELSSIMHELNRKRRELLRLTHRTKPGAQLLNGHASSDEDDREAEASSPEPPRSPSPPTLHKVKFLVRPPKPTIATPHNIPPPRKFASFEDFLDHDSDAPRLTRQLESRHVEQEARTRLRIRAARRPGGLLDRKVYQARPNPQREPDRQYTHRDHLLGHISHFTRLLKQEHRDHVKKAQILAHDAKRFVEAKAQMNRVKTAEEIEQEKALLVRGFYRDVVKDLGKLWLAVELEVVEMRRKEKEEEEKAKIRSGLERTLDKAQKQLDASMRHGESDGGSDVESGHDGEDDGADSSADDDSENMSESDSSNNDDDEDDTAQDPDDGMTQEELLAKYGNVPSLMDEQPSQTEGSPLNDDNSKSAANRHNDRSISEIDDSNADGSSEKDKTTTYSGPDLDSVMDDGPLEPDKGTPSVTQSRRTRASSGTSLRSSVHSDDEDVDSSDTSVTMDSEEDEEDEDEDEDDDQEEEEESGFGGLSSLFSKKEQQEIREKYEQQYVKEEEAAGTSPDATPDPPESDLADGAQSKTLPEEEVDSEVRDVSAHDEHTSRDPSTQASPRTSVTKASEPESISSLEPPADLQVMTTPENQKSHLKTPVPHLFRGTLREYQHEGLDWLADLYEKGRNGILADEMGLGKTIQSIALLAHLAVEHEVWSPHLIVVPTSVMLNWEMEFKKFCPGFKVLTYYGSQQERAQKRKGWMTPDAFNVCITSYQLVLQDQNIFKRRAWHYMILDEAHNIKNFRSGRWQTMMTFNTRARLLLTGTPLQNNLTELWSLLYFLHFGQEIEFADLNVFTEWFRTPVESILERGRQVLTQEDKESVEKLHKVIRPFLLRRLKKDVEKQMPLKYEHVELCRLSKRQRQLYDGFMSRAATKETLSSGNYLSIINALMQLRKVCNHPDLFETRPITTSLALPRSEARKWEPNYYHVRRLLNQTDPFEKIDLNFLQLCPISREEISANEVMERARLFAFSNSKLLQIRETQWRRTNLSAVYSGADPPGVLESLRDIRKASLLRDLDRTMYIDTYRHRGRPLIGRALLEQLAFGTTYEKLSRPREPGILAKRWDLELPTSSLNLIKSVDVRSQLMEPLIQRFACVTPPVTAFDVAENLLSEVGVEAVRSLPTSMNRDPFHEARIRLSIAFPDKRLLQYDCGKLQRLDRLLRQLQAGGHRALIFTQMTKVLDVLEQFLNIHGHRYLRLDGATKVEQRQILTDRFNNDTRILCFILSSRSGGLGINLTGADTVIFYDLDWNPAMDKQCTDRAHRIGQTRDVHIYRFVSEHTIEANILRKASQKQMLDDVVIQEGDFTTDFFNRASYKDMLPDEDEAMASAAMDRVLGTEQGSAANFEGAEDKEDIAAAKVAALEDQHADDGDFEDEDKSSHAKNRVLGPYAATNAALAEAEGEIESTVDGYMVRFMKHMLKGVPLDGRERRKKAKKTRKGDPHLKATRKSGH